MSDDPIGGLIVIARKKAKASGGGYTAHAKNCTCWVEVNMLTENSTREHYSRCALHPVR